MKSAPSNPRNFNDYLSPFPPDVRTLLKKLRAAIKKAAPRAGEKISYGVPAFVLHGPLVYFAAFKKHLSLFPTSSGIRHFKKELAPYKTSRGTVQFPLDQPVPLLLVTRIVKFRVKENLKKAAARRDLR